MQKDLYLAVGMHKTDNPSMRTIYAVQTGHSPDCQESRLWALVKMGSILVNASHSKEEIAVVAAAQHGRAIVDAFFRDRISMAIESRDGMSYYLTTVTMDEQPLAAIVNTVPVSSGHEVVSEGIATAFEEFLKDLG